MTNVNPKPHSAQKSFAPGSSRGPRSVRTFLDQMARAEDARTSERGDRIRELRAGIPQPRIADQVGVTLRAYQEWEAGGGIGWDNLVKLAEVFGVTEEYIEFGVAGRPRPGTDLHRLERKIDALLLAAGMDPALYDEDADVPGDAAEVITRGFEDPGTDERLAADEAAGDNGPPSDATPAAPRARAPRKRRSA